MQKYDASRRDVEFKVGYLVYLKLQPYRQKFLVRQREKLEARFYGPFEVTERVGKVVYRLKVPSSAQIHAVFHVLQLKKAVGTQPLSKIPPQLISDLVLEVQLATLLGVHNANEKEINLEVLI